MSPTLRIAILECDTPLTKTRAKYGGYGGVFTFLLQGGAKSIDLPEEDLNISKWDVVEKQEYPELGDIDAVLITGSSEYISQPVFFYCVRKLFVGSIHSIEHYPRTRTKADSRHS